MERLLSLAPPAIKNISFFYMLLVGTFVASFSKQFYHDKKDIPILSICNNTAEHGGANQPTNIG